MQISKVPKQKLCMSWDCNTWQRFTKHSFRSFPLTICVPHNLFIMCYCRKYWICQINFASSCLPPLLRLSLFSFHFNSKHIQTECLYLMGFNRSCHIYYFCFFRVFVVAIVCLLMCSCTIDNLHKTLLIDLIQNVSFDLFGEPIKKKRWKCTNISFRINTNNSSNTERFITTLCLFWVPIYAQKSCWILNVVY